MFNLSSEHGPQKYPPISQYVREVFVVPSPSPAAGTLYTTVSVTLPGGLPPPAYFGPRPATGQSTPIAYVQMVLQNQPKVTLSGLPGMGFFLRPGFTYPSGVYQVEKYEQSNPGWQFVGPATLNGQTMSWNGTHAPFVLPADDTISFAFVASGQSHSGVIVIVPSTSASAPYQITAGKTVTITASESGYSGSFTSSSSNTAVAIAGPNPSTG
ncbi:MAG: hypothetical protein JO199_12830, partial [Candidatus Eremiobacteraeota bacterium]|nr:hypothetical protein [Candidatus Eremiobacteraeota bacterium]